MPVDPYLKQRARQLRQEMTPAEKILWGVVRGRRFAGFKFRRQQVLGPFIVDFFCAEATLVLEIDGESHLGKEQPDRVRQDWLEREGFKVLRIWNTEIYDEQDAVEEMIWRACYSRGKSTKAMHPSPPAPLPQGERGERGVSRPRFN
jgi:very-short-patch-repair endonuclease